MQIQTCAFDGYLLAGAPQVRWVQGLNAEDRDIARHQVRSALRSCLAEKLGCSPDELEITNVRGRPAQVFRNSVPLKSLYCSISHASGSALLAWSWDEQVGVDVQAVDTDVPVHELLAISRLYFEKKSHEALVQYAQGAHFFGAFSQAWAAQEARLKCAGLGLVEWSETLELQLQTIRCTSLVLTEYLRGAVAWR